MKCVLRSLGPDGRPPRESNLAERTSFAVSFHSLNSVCFPAWLTPFPELSAPRRETRASPCITCLDSRRNAAFFALGPRISAHCVAFDPWFAGAFIPSRNTWLAGPDRRASETRLRL